MGYFKDLNYSLLYESQGKSSRSKSRGDLEVVVVIIRATRCGRNPLGEILGPGAAKMNDDRTLRIQRVRGSSLVQNMSNDSDDMDGTHWNQLHHFIDMLPG